MTRAAELALLLAALAVLSVSVRDDGPREVRCATAMKVTCGSWRAK